MAACKIWKKSLDRDGYGRFEMKGKTYRAHRYFYEMENGIIPESLVIDHLCRNRACINTEHMETVTVKENTIRGKAAKINRELAQKVRRMYKARKITQVELSHMFGIVQDEISRIVNYRRWA